VKRFLAGIVVVAGAVATWGAVPALAAPVPSAPSSSAVPPIPGVHAYTDTYTVQQPYNLPVSARFSVDPGPVYNAWVLKGDKPLRKGSNTGPRTEMRWSLNWSKGLHVWEADVNVDAGTTLTAIMQVKGGAGDEAIYAEVIKGTLENMSSGAVLATNVYGRWFHMVCAFDPGTATSRIWVDGQLKQTAHYGKRSTWYFKNGVYSSGYHDLTTPRSEAHFKNIQFWMA
jgi:hypothetical protein